MPDWIIYSSNYDAAVADLASINADRVDGSRILADMTPPVRNGSKAMALVRSETEAGDQDLNAVIEKGNLQILGIFDQGSFVAVSDTARAIFDQMKPVTVTKQLFGQDYDVIANEQFAQFS